MTSVRSTARPSTTPPTPSAPRPSAPATCTPPSSSLSATATSPPKSPPPPPSTTPRATTSSTSTRTPTATAATATPARSSRPEALEGGSHQLVGAAFVCRKWQRMVVRSGGAVIVCDPGLRIVEGWGGMRVRWVGSALAVVGALVAGGSPVRAEAALPSSVPCRNHVVWTDSANAVQEVDVAAAKAPQGMGPYQLAQFVPVRAMSTWYMS